MRDHTKLRAFELADALVFTTYRATAGFPQSELFGLASQMRRAAIGTASNIVEGCARNSRRDYVRFLDIAYSSARELEYQASLAHRLGYLDDRVHAELRSACIETSKVLGGLVRSLRDGRT